MTNLDDEWVQIGDPDIRVHGITVCRNEAGRWLESSLAWNSALCDTFFMYDDQSTDDSPTIATNTGVTVIRRPDDVPSFLEHEGRFRQGAWDAFEATVQPVEGDWVLSIDTDEFLVSNRSHIPNRLALRASAAFGELSGYTASMVPIPEIWGLAPVMRRTDGAWGGVRSTRLFRYQGGGVFRDKAMGSGSEPSYVGKRATFSEVNILHAGYAHADDVRAKFERYTTLLAHGHADAHIQSIIAMPTLEPYEGRVPDWYRGVR